MGYRNIFIENDYQLSTKNNCLIIKNEEVQESIPIEDINMIMIDNHMCLLSTKLINKMSDNHVLLYICNEKHLPSTITLSINNYCRQLKRYQEQMNLSKNLQKSLWKSVVMQKIENQANCLEYLQIDGYRYLKNLSQTVSYGDKENVEAIAASFYLKKLLGNDFTRNQGHIINASLNYGYAIIRGMIARSLVAYGFETSIGIFHHNELNNFNLADDIIEDFRPLVDLYVYSRIPEYETELTPSIKREMLNITNQLIKIDNKLYNVQNAIDYVVMGLSKSFREGKNCLVLPKLIPLKQYYFI